MRINRSTRGGKVAAILSIISLVGIYAPVIASDDDVYQLDIEDLLNIEVTSVSKKAQRLSDAAAAIFVISNEDIERSGVTSIPEALRMAPGVNVARVDSNKWAVSIRGFNGRFARKLLVLIDGRSVYTPTFSGVYWEMQDVMLEDVKRIEVIRGPGAALWGANAVNGVINIITRHSADTQGGLLTVGGGTEERGFAALRYGAQLSSDTTGRVYVKGFQRDQFVNQAGGKAGDDWDKVQGGFRLDSSWSDKDQATLQGDVYYSNLNQDVHVPSLAAPYVETTYDSATALGGNLLARMHHTFSANSDYTAQFYYDFYDRSEVLAHELRQTLDIDFQHHFQLNSWNDMLWGLGYRYTHDDTKGSFSVSINPGSRNDQLVTAFLQDEITLVNNRLWLTLGSRFEHNDYSGFEVQPTARLMWKPHRQHRVWAAVSRAVRTPARVNQDASIIAGVLPPDSTQNPLSLPVAISVMGSSSFKAEEMLSYELGYRVALTKALSLDMAAFYNHYDALLSLQQGRPIISTDAINQPFVQKNGNSAETYGFELTSVWQMQDWWQWNLNYSFARYQIHRNFIDNSRVYDPQQTASVHTALSPWKTVTMDFSLHYVDQFVLSAFSQTLKIKGYTNLDVRLAWKPKSNLELSVIGQNLLDRSHLEYLPEQITVPTEVERGVYGKFSLNF